MLSKQDLSKLNESRVRYAKEIQKAIHCKTNQEKLDLVAEWKAKYSETMVTELINIAKSKERYSISKWDIKYR